MLVNLPYLPVFILIVDLGEAQIFHEFDNIKPKVDDRLRHFDMWYTISYLRP